MVQVIMDHGVSWWFGTSLTPNAQGVGYQKSFLLPLRFFRKKQRASPLRGPALLVLPFLNRNGLGFPANPSPNCQPSQPGTKEDQGKRLGNRLGSAGLDLPANLNIHFLLKRTVMVAVIAVLTIIADLTLNTVLTIMVAIIPVLAILVAVVAVWASLGKITTQSYGNDCGRYQNGADKTNLFLHFALPAEVACT